MKIRPDMVIDADALKEACRQHRVATLSLFGSVLTDRFTEASDVDVLVEFEPHARVGFIALGQLKTDLERIFRRRVDVVPLLGLKPRIRDSILSEARALHAA